MPLDHRMGWLEGLVDALDKRMTRREAEDAEWRDDMKSKISDNQDVLSEIDRKLSESIGVLRASKWIVGIISLFSVPSIGWLLTHPWPFGK